MAGDSLRPSKRRAEKEGETDQNPNKASVIKV